MVERFEHNCEAGFGHSIYYNAFVYTWVNIWAQKQNVRG